MLKNVLGFAPWAILQTTDAGETGQPGPKAICMAHLGSALSSWCPCLPPGPLPVWDAESSGAGGPAQEAWAPPSSCAGHRASQSIFTGVGRVQVGLKRPCLPQAAPRASTASSATRSATVPTVAAATASTGPASVTRGSTAASATWVSPLPWLLVSGGGVVLPQQARMLPCLAACTLAREGPFLFGGQRRAQRGPPAGTWAPGTQSHVLWTLLAFGVPGGGRGPRPSVAPCPTTGLRGRRELGQGQTSLGSFWGWGLSWLLEFAGSKGES